MGSGCCSVGRAVASDYWGPQFESSHWQKFILNVYCQLNWKDENKEKEAPASVSVISFYIFLIIVPFFKCTIYFPSKSIWQRGSSSKPSLSFAAAVKDVVVVGCSNIYIENPFDVCFRKEEVNQSSPHCSKSPAYTHSLSAASTLPPTFLLLKHFPQPISPTQAHARNTPCLDVVTFPLSSRWFPRPLFNGVVVVKCRNPIGPPRSVSTNESRGRRTQCLEMWISPLKNELKSRFNKIASEVHLLLNCIQIVILPSRYGCLTTTSLSFIKCLPTYFLRV